MEHFLKDLIFPLVCSLIFFHIAFIVGNKLLKLLSFPTVGVDARRTGLSVLLGYGVLSYGTLIMSFFGPLSWWVIWLIVVIVLVLGRQTVFTLYKNFFSYIHPVVKKWTVEEKILLLLIGCGVVFYALSAFVPPYRNDAIAYHLPETMVIAKEGIKHFPIGVSKFFGNLPLLMETLYALLYTVQGFVLINLTHFQILLAALAVCYSFVKNNFSRRTSLLALVVILTLYEVFVNATNAYIDGATIAFEVAGFLTLIEWCSNKQKKLLTVIGLLFGLALATKYNALYGVVGIV